MLMDTKGFRVPKEDINRIPLINLLSARLDSDGNVKIVGATGLWRGKLIDPDNAKIMCVIQDSSYYCPKCGAKLDIEEARHLDGEGLPIYTCCYCESQIDKWGRKSVIRSYKVEEEDDNILFTVTGEEEILNSYIPLLETF